MIKVLIVIFVILGMLFLAGGGYFLGMTFPMGGNSASPSPEVLVSPAPSMQPAVSPSSSASSTAGMSDMTSPDGPQLGDVLGPNDAQRAIEKAIEENNFDKVEANFADKVTLIQYGTSCCGETADMVKVLEFISGKAKGDGPWVFNSSDAKYEDLNDDFDFFAISKSGAALGFDLNADNKLKAVTYYGDYRLAEG